MLTTGTYRPYTLEYASMRGAIDTVSWAFEVRGHRPTRRAFENAASHGQLQILTSRVATVPPINAFHASREGNVAALE